MSIEKPVIGQPGWGLVLNAALDELDLKETSEGAEAKATQAYDAATEYTDTRINEVNEVLADVSDANVAPVITSGSATGAALDARITTRTSGKVDIATLSADAAAHVSDGSALDGAVSAKMRALTAVHGTDVDAFEALLPSGTEYVYMLTDGDGTLLDILSGKKA